MKKSLAPPRRDLRPNMLNNRKQSPKLESSKSKEKNLSNTRQTMQKPITTAYEQKFRNKNLNAIPTPLLVTISGLNTLDISYNKLNDSQIELVMNSCPKLVTLCIQGNINTIIPAAIWKLKELANFKHDWLKFVNSGGSGTQESYQSDQRLRKLKINVQKPDMVVKFNRIVGMDFQVYSKEIGHITLDYSLIEIVQKSDCSETSKEAMYKIIKDAENSRNKTKTKGKPTVERDEFIACRAVCGIDNNLFKKEQKPGSVNPKRDILSAKQLSEAQTDAGSKKIKIQEIRDISEKQLTFPTAISSYSAPGMRLHQLLATFDSNPTASSQIDGLLLKGYNPNQYDNNGLSPYHVCLTYGQKRGFQYLINISANNPGFFDLEMPSQKQCRNILHYSVFLKNYTFTKQLIDFGIPTDKRDSSGNRIIHLVDQNLQFLLLLRKIHRKTTASARSQNVLATIQNKKKYVKHPQRNKEQSKFRITYSKNEKILEMFQSAVGLPFMKKSP